ncbi:MAG: hypothetical protein DMD98_08690 [Candidatus Rokuibacteriota bacterium]|nr:MAG: hypothetical protein DMD98_08690 [Candidatus Rokubacteria bacterium]
MACVGSAGGGAGCSAGCGAGCSAGCGAGCSAGGCAGCSAGCCARANVPRGPEMNSDTTTASAIDRAISLIACLLVPSANPRVKPSISQTLSDAKISERL